VPCAAVRGKRTLELLHVPAPDEPRLLQDPLDRPLQFRSQLPDLAAKLAKADHATSWRYLAPCSR
jgi:hypothetical protein